MSTAFSHITADNQPGMVDVGEKKVTVREAEAQSIVWLGKENIDLFEQAGWENKKGGILQTAIIAGTMAAKKTGDLIPMCHPLGLESCKINIEVQAESLKIT